MRIIKFNNYLIYSNVSHAGLSWAKKIRKVGVYVDGKNPQGIKNGAIRLNARWGERLQRLRKAIKKKEIEQKNWKKWRGYKKIRLINKDNKEKWSRKGVEEFYCTRNKVRLW